MMDRKLTFNYLISTCNMKLGVIFRFAKEFNNIKVYQTLYCSLIRQKLEYCCMVWSPQYITHMDRIEAIQKKFLRRVLQHFPWKDPVRLPPYEHRLNLLEMSTLKKRRNVLSIVFVCKVLNGDVFSPCILKLLSLKVPSIILRNFTILRYDIRTNYNYLKFEPTNVMINLFNENYSSIDFNLSYDRIKHKLLRN